MTDKYCKTCENASNYDGQLRCIKCYRVYVPLDLIEVAGEQLPVIIKKGTSMGKTELIGSDWYEPLGSKIEQRIE